MWKRWRGRGSSHLFFGSPGPRIGAPGIVLGHPACPRPVRQWWCRSQLGLAIPATATLATAPIPAIGAAPLRRLYLQWGLRHVSPRNRSSVLREVCGRAGNNPSVCMYHPCLSSSALCCLLGTGFVFLACEKRATKAPIRIHLQRLTKFSARVLSILTFLWIYAMF
jgi:hypothetical protein